LPFLQMLDYTILKGSLWDKMRDALVKAAGSRGIPLRQSYCRLKKRALAKQSSSAHAPQMTRRLKTYRGRVYRDICNRMSNSMNYSDWQNAY